MLYLSSYLAVFWRLPWSAPLRSALTWQTEALPQTLAAPPEAPRWLRPLCVQRMVGRAIAARAAWLAQHSCPAPYRFGNDSLPDWSKVGLLRYDCRILRAMSDEPLLWMFGMEVERVLRLILTSPAELGEGAWLAALLGASEHIAQVYHELRRRCKAMRARAILREELQRFVEWPGDEVAGRL